MCPDSYWPGTTHWAWHWLSQSSRWEPGYDYFILWRPYGLVSRISVERLRRTRSRKREATISAIPSAFSRPWFLCSRGDPWTQSQSTCQGNVWQWALWHWAVSRVPCPELAIGVCTILTGLISIKGLRQRAQCPETLRSAGIYLHILSSKRKPSIFWLYVLQAVCLKDRVRDHHNRRHQSSHFSLHYHVWNSPEAKDSLFVTLWVDNKLNCNLQQLLLNVAEMWLCCIFRALTPHHLDQYLPGNVSKPWAGCHLNVALPLWQSFSKPVDKAAKAGGRDVFSDFLRASDPNVRKWAQNLRDAFNELRDSPDSKLRRYYAEHKRRALESATDAQQLAAREKLNEFLPDKKTPIRVLQKKNLFGALSQLYEIHCGKFLFIISQKMDPNSRTRIQFFFSFISLRPSIRKNMPSCEQNRPSQSTGSLDYRTWHPRRFSCLACL